MTAIASVSVIIMNPPNNQPLDLQAVSALMDGQLRDADAAAAMGLMSSSQARECWQLYHLVGDVLRSADLAACGQDPGLATRVVARIQQEARPVVAMAPAAAPARDVTRPAANDGVFRWRMVAGLASFAAVAAIGWGLLGGMGPRPDGAAQLAQGAAGPRGTVQALASVTPPQPAADPDDIHLVQGAGGIVRDPRLDELLRAHRQISAPPALGGFVLNATFEGAER